MDLSLWEDPDPAEIIPLGSQAEWDALLSRFGGINDQPLRRCLEVAQLGGAACVVRETRYLDLDYRSEFSAFYSRTFAAIPDSATRLHFFRTQLAAEQLWTLPPDHGYLGYVVVRPSPIGQVGRTMLVPPPDLAAAIRTGVTDEVNFFGQRLTVTGVPFMQQDTQLGRCAHAAAWVCHYTSVRRGQVSRRPMAQFGLSVDPSVSLSRLVPSEGLTALQIMDLLRSFELAPRFYNVKQLPSSTAHPSWAVRPTKIPTTVPIPHPGLWDDRIIQIACRYLNSGIPVLVGTADHAFVLCGYQREPRKAGRDWIRFIRQDDQWGPYIEVSSVFNDSDQAGNQYAPWQLLIAPLPDKLWLPAEPAEGSGGVRLEELATGVVAAVPEAQVLLDRIQSGRLTLRTYAASSNDWKVALAGRVAPDLVREYRTARFSRYIWVVEAIDREARTAGQPSVLGEAIFDATSSDSDPNPLAVHVPGVALVARTDGGLRFPIRCDPSPYLSGGVGDP
jgi:hypothetical protein